MNIQNHVILLDRIERMMRYLWSFDKWTTDEQQAAYDCLWQQAADHRQHLVVFPKNQTFIRKQI